MKKKQVFKSLMFCLCGTAMTLCVTACAEKEGTTSEPLILLLNKENLGLDVFEQYDLDVENGEQIVWSSEDERIATVNADGIVTGVSQGTTNIIATVGDQTLKCEVTVRASEDVPTIVLDEETVELLIGDDYTVSPKVLYKKNKYEAEYAYISRNEQVATVDENGKITAVDFGMAKIEVSANWGIYANSIYLKKIVDVIVKEDVTLRIESDAVSLFPGDTEQLTAIAKVNGIETADGLVWSSSDSEIVSVDQNGKMTAGTKFGTAEISVSYTSKKNTYKSLPVLVTLNKPVRDLTKEVVFDYDLSKQAPLSFNDINGLDGAILKITLDETDITSYLNEGEIAYDTASEYPLGVHALTIITDKAVYKLTMTIASYVISDTESWDSWYSDIAATAHTAQADLYVVVGSDFTYTGTGCSVWPSGNFTGSLKGTFDGRGHVITGMKIGTYTLFSFIYGTMKNIAFKDLTSNGSNAAHGLLARYGHSGTLENVYISGTATGGITDIIATYKGNTVTVKNCIFNVTLSGTGNNLFFNTVEVTPIKAKIENVYAITTTKTAIAEGYEGGIYAAATEDFLTAVSSNMSGSLFSVKDSALYFNGQLLMMAKGQETLAAADYDLSKGAALTVGGISGSVTKVTLDSADITADVTLGENSISVDYDKAKSYALGVHTMTIETATTVYTSELTIASYVISDTASWTTWYDAIAATKRSEQADLYVVVGSDFTYTGDACTIYSGSPFNGTLKGTFDGRGHVITGMKIGDYALFSYLDGTMKNIAFKDLTSKGYNAKQGLLARFSWGGTLENVYISGAATVGNGTTDIIASHAGGTVTVKNCIFNVTLSGTGNNLFFNTATGTKTFENVYAITTTKAAIAEGYEGGIYAAATEDFLTAVSANMSGSLFSVKDSALYFGATKLF